MPESFASTSNHAAEVIVVGAGHNGLIAAAYLARSGFDTLLLEARSSVGGCSSTEEDLGARFNICNCDHTMVRAMPMIDELGLADHGLEYLENEVGYVSAFHDDSEPWLFFHEIDRTLEEIAAVYPDQLEGYRRYLDDALPVSRLILDIARTRPSITRILATTAARKAQGAARLLEWSRRSAQEVMSRYFSAWQLTMPAFSTGPTVWGVAPETPGTGLAAAGYATRHLVKSGRPRGGSGALGDSLLRCFEAAGGRVRCEARVARILIDDGAAIGVELDDGQRLTSSTIVAACDPQRVFVDWVDDPPPAARRLVERWRGLPVRDGYESKIDAVLDRVPTPKLAERVAARHPGVDLLGPTTVLSPSPAQLAEGHRLRAEDRVAPFPTFLSNLPSVLDPSMAPSDGHVLSLEVLFTPYALEGGWPDSHEPRRWLELWAQSMEPGALDSVRDWRAMTPDVYEAQFSMHRGHTPAFAGSPLATLIGRRSELTRYRTPLAGLYLCGAGTYPGAGVFGASGRNAAAVVEHDRHHPIGRRLMPARTRLAEAGRR